jgi:hypothetical protein
MADLPIACTLSPAALKARRENVLNQLVRRAHEVQERPDGCRLRFAPDSGILEDIARTIDAERECCRFLQFTLTVEAASGPITLDLTGPTGTREFLAGLFEP